MTKTRTYTLCCLVLTVIFCMVAPLTVKGATSAVLVNKSSAVGGPSVDSNTGGPSYTRSSSAIQHTSSASGKQSASSKVSSTMSSSSSSVPSNVSDFASTTNAEYQKQSRGSSVVNNLYIIGAAILLLFIAFVGIYILYLNGVLPIDQILRRISGGRYSMANLKKVDLVFMGILLVVFSVALITGMFSKLILFICGVILRFVSRFIPELSKL